MLWSKFPCSLIWQPVQLCRCMWVPPCETISHPKVNRQDCSMNPSDEIVNGRHLNCTFPVLLTTNEWFTFTNSHIHTALLYQVLCLSAVHLIHMLPEQPSGASGSSVSCPKSLRHLWSGWAWNQTTDPPISGRPTLSTEPQLPQVSDKDREETRVNIGLALPGRRVRQIC